MNVLIIDDQYINRYLLEKLLAGYGYTVISAVDGIEALEKLKEGSINLIISDILLPRMDGFQLCREVKQNPEYASIPFIFYTAAYTEQKDREFAESLGADRFILKPADPAEFITVVQDLIKDIPEDGISPARTIILGEHEYLSEHNSRLLHQLEKKLNELESVNKALRISEKRYKNLFEFASDAIILHEITSFGEFGRILEANGNASAILGYSHDELLAMNMTDIDTAKQSVHYQEFMKALLSSKKLTFEGEYRTKSGSTIPVEISAYLYDENGTRLCLIISRDITFRKQTMDKLSGAIAQIDDNLHQIATIGDQIRNPLSVIMSYCDENRNAGYDMIMDAVREIDSFVQKLDTGSVESEKVRRVLAKILNQGSYGVGIDDSK